jgi:hypothetical protein
MEYWESKSDNGLILCSDQFQPYKIQPYKNRSHSAKPSIPTFQYSIIPVALAAEFTAEPIISDLAQRTRFFMLEKAVCSLQVSQVDVLKSNYKDDSASRAHHLIY